MDSYAFSIEEANLRNPSRREAVRGFLAAQGLCFDETVQKYYTVHSGDELVGGAGYDGNVIKCVAVDPRYRGEGLLNGLMTRIVTELCGKYGNLFVFTKPENRALFQSLGFNTVETTSQVILMETDASGLSRFCDNVSHYRKGGVGGAIVMNCNPFTLGHRHLVQEASRQCDYLLIFAVEEDKSEFPFAVRLRLMREGVEDIGNVSVLPGGPYIISSATFPTYFLKDASSAAEAHTELDVTLFGRRIAPAGGITRRFVGEEPFSPVTNLYNETMARLLPSFGVTLSIIPRLEKGNVAISASAVRRLLAEGRLEDARGLVPETTYRYLASNDAEPVLARIRG